MNLCTQPLSPIRTGQLVLLKRSHTHLVEASRRPVVAVDQLDGAEDLLRAGRRDRGRVQVCRAVALEEIDQVGVAGDVSAAGAKGLGESA